MTSAQIQNLIVSTANAFGLDPRLALEVAITESNLNPNAVSSAGAVGIFQLMPATAAQFGVSDPTDPTQNIYAGVQYLVSLISQFGDVSQALGAYNWGPGNVQAAVSQYGQDWLSHAPGETQAYIATILGAIGSQYTVSPAATASPTPDFSGATVSESGFVPPASGLSFGTIAVLLGMALLGMMLLSD